MSPIHVDQNLPDIDPHKNLLIYDQHLATLNQDIRTWIENFPMRYAVKAGEELKAIEHFAKHVQSIFKLLEAHQCNKPCIIAMGGGSVGDFSGFLASTLKRGVPLHMLPSTWLAAIDSAHGGKTALNVGSIKNQLGTFYPAEQVILCKALLASQPEERAIEAWGELVKIALIDGGAWVDQLTRDSATCSQLLWEMLEPAITAKNKIVEQDPREQNGLRQVLNLGHTMGHAFETFYEWPHGIAVAHGLAFSLQWGLHRQITTQACFDQAMQLLNRFIAFKDASVCEPFTQQELKQLLLQDKKVSDANHSTFIFLKDIGNAQRLQVNYADIIQEARRQAWIRS